MILYNGCVFSITNAPGIALLQERRDLSLIRLQKEFENKLISASVILRYLPTASFFLQFPDDLDDID